MVLLVTKKLYNVSFCLTFLYLYFYTVTSGIQKMNNINHHQLLTGMVTAALGMLILPAQGYVMPHQAHRLVVYASDASSLLAEARDGDRDSMRKLGDLIMSGTVNKRVVQEGVDWLKAEAEGGDAEALYIMGNMHMRGRGVEKSKRMAVEYYARASELGYTEGDEIIKKHPVEYAVAWWESKAEAEDKQAVLRLMVAYAIGEEELPVDMDKARGYYAVAKKKWPQEVEQCLSSLVPRIRKELTAPREDKPVKLEIGDTPSKSLEQQLWEAAYEADILKVRSLLKAGVSPDAMSEDNTTPLQIATMVKDGAPIVRAMIEAGADVNKANDAGITPLFFACLKPDIDTGIPQMLIKAGAKFNARTEKGETPLMIAACTGKEKAVRALLAAGADINVICEEKGLAHIGCIQVDSSFDAPYDALKIAYCKKFDNIVKLLIEAGADANAKYSGTPMVFKYLDNPAMLRVFLKHGYRLENKDAKGNTALIQTVGIPNWESAEILIRAGANVNVGDSEHQFTPLMVAAFLNEIDLMKLIIKKGGDVNAKSSARSCNSTALQVAAGEGHLDAVKILIEAGADVNYKSTDGLSAEEIARKKGHTAVAEYIHKEVQKRKQKKAKKEKKSADKEEADAEEATESEEDSLILYAGIGGGVLVLVIVAVVLMRCLKKKPAAVPATPTVDVPKKQAAPAKKKRSAAPVAQPQPKPEPPPAQPQQAPPPAPYAPSAAGPLYHVKLIDGKSVGQYPAEALKYYLHTGALPPNIVVWTEGMPGWLPVSQVRL